MLQWNTCDVEAHHVLPACDEPVIAMTSAEDDRWRLTDVSSTLAPLSMIV